MNKKGQFTRRINKLKKQIKTEKNKVIKQELKEQKRVLERIKKQEFGTPKKRKYTYKSQATKQAAIQRGKQLKARITPEEQAKINLARTKGLENYRQAEKIAKTDEVYKRYWEEIKSLRKQAARLGKTFSLEHITGSPMQLKEAQAREGRLTPETQARFSLGLSAGIDVAVLMSKALDDGIINPIIDENGELIGYSYENKVYTVEEMTLMMSSPRKFFAPKSLFWNWVDSIYWENGGGESGDEVVSQEVFGS